MSWKIPLTGYEISEIATKYPEVRSQTQEATTSQDAATHPRTRTHALTPPRGDWAAPPFSPALALDFPPPSRREYRYFGSVP